jgi:hypothetical protein
MPSGRTGHASPLTRRACKSPGQGAGDGAATATTAPGSGWMLRGARACRRGTSSVTAPQSATRVPVAKSGPPATSPRGLDAASTAILVCKATRKRERCANESLNTKTSPPPRRGRVDAQTQATPRRTHSLCLVAARRVSVVRPGMSARRRPLLIPGGRTRSRLAAAAQFVIAR